MYKKKVVNYCKVLLLFVVLFGLFNAREKLEIKLSILTSSKHVSSTQVFDQHPNGGKTDKITVGLVYFSKKQDSK